MTDLVIQSKFDSFIERYSDLFLSDEEIWNNNLQKTIDFIDENGKRPNSNSKIPSEKFLGQWICNQLNSRDKCIQIMSNSMIRDKWDEFVRTYSELFLSNEEIWNNNLQKTIDFIEENGRRPIQKSKIPSEKVLGQWISTQLKNRKKCTHIMKDEKIREIWDKFAADYLE